MFAQKMKGVRVIILCSLALLVLGALTSSGNTTSMYAAQTGFDVYDQQAINHINAYRASHGCSPLIHAPEYQAGVEAWVLQSTYPGQHRNPAPLGEIIAFVTDYAPVDEGAYEALHSFWKTSFDHNERLINCTKYPFTRIAIAHGLRSFSGYTPNPGWLWVAELVTGGSPPPPTPAPPGPPNISQVGRYIPSTYNPALNSRPTFEITLKNNSAYEARINEVFLRLIHQQSGAEFKATLWFPSSGHAVIAPGGTRTFTGRPPAMPYRGLWRVEKVEIQTNTGAWLPGINQYGWIMVHETNFALNRPVYVHSVRDGSGNSPPKVNDGLPTTRWESAWYDDQMIEIDLGQTRTINTVMLHWESAYASVFRVKIGSNCSSNPNQCTWTQVYATSSGNGRDVAITFNGISARWVKIELVQRGTPWGFSLWEFEVYNRYTG